MNFRPSLFFPGIVFLLLSCDPDRVMDEYRSIEKGIWQADSVISFEFSMTGKKENHNLYFNIRHDQTYPFSNLWLFVSIEPPQGEGFTDTVQVILAEPSGKWMGRGLSGVYDQRQIYRRNVFFPESGLYSIHIRHGMRSEKLEGITDVGIRIERVN